jgi:hypothetical protein
VRYAFRSRSGASAPRIALVVVLLAAYSEWRRTVVLSLVSALRYLYYPSSVPARLQVFLPPLLQIKQRRHYCSSLPSPSPPPPSSTSPPVPVSRRLARFQVVMERAPHGVRSTRSPEIMVLLCSFYSEIGHLSPVQSLHQIPSTLYIIIFLFHTPNALLLTFIL